MVTQAQIYLAHLKAGSPKDDKGRHPPMVEQALKQAHALPYWDGAPGLKFIDGSIIRNDRIKGFILSNQ